MISDKHWLPDVGYVYIAALNFIYIYIYISIHYSIISTSWLIKVLGIYIFFVKNSVHENQGFFYT